MPKPFNKTDNPGLPFPPGRSGNLGGRPPSIERVRRDVARELINHGGVLTKLCVQKALTGDAACLAACVSMLGTVTAATVLRAELKPPAE